MERLIDANKLWLAMASDQTVDQYCYPCTERILKAIKEQPTVDAVPVRHGKWIKIHPQDIYECSECHQNVMTSDIECYKFCHRCGARMDEERGKKNDYSRTSRGIPLQRSR